MALAKLYNLVRVTTTTVGTGTINLGSAVPGALNFADAGVQDGDVVSYGIKNSTASEVGRGTYSSSGPTLARTTVLKSTNGGSALNLTGNNAEVFITALAEDFDVTGNLAGGFWSSSDVASAATCDIGAANTPYVRIIGTTTITSLGTQPNRFRFVQFTGSLTLTYNGTSLILPGALNIITAAGDVAEFVSDATGNWRCTDYHRNSGKPPVGAPVGTTDTQTLTNKTLTNPIVGTQTAGDNSTKAASTAYVDTAVGYLFPVNVLNYIPESEWAAIRAYTSTTDLLTYFNSAISALASAGGGILLVPRGLYNVSAVVTITSNSIRIVGEGDSASNSQGTVIQCTHATVGDIISFSGAQHSTIENVRLTCKNVVTSGAAVGFINGAFNCEARRLRIEYCYNGIVALKATETIIDSIQIRYLFGTRGIQYGGNSSSGCFGITINRVVCDNPYPLTNNGTRKSWATSTAFSLNDIVFVNSKVWQCTTAGTSSNAGTGPSTTPGSGGSSCFSTTVTDGTAAWKFVCADLAWFNMDSFAYSVRIAKCAFLDGRYGVYMSDSQNTGSSYPVWIEAFDVECDHNYVYNVLLDRGEGAYFTSSWFGSALTAHGVLVNTNHRGEVFIGGGTRISGVWQNGILIQSGPVDVRVDGCFIGGNSQSGSASFHGITVGNNATRFYLTNNRIGPLVGSGTEKQGFGIVTGGTSDNYIIQGNACFSNVTGKVSDSGSGTNKSVTGNI